MKTYKEQIDQVDQSFLIGEITESYWRLLKGELHDRERLMKLGGFDQEEVDELTYEEVKESLKDY